MSLISFQIILVISSPSSSTTGFLTLIFLNEAIFRDWVNAEPRLALVAKCAGDTLFERAVAVQRVRERVVREAFIVRE